MACFSIARDDKDQWRKYADNGHGVCLGVRVLNEPAPHDPRLGAALIKVDYSESSWQATLKTNFKMILEYLVRAAITKKSLSLGLSALYRIAAFASISAKQERWASKQEFRHVTLVRQGATVEIKERLAGGKIIRYLPVAVRADSKKIALAEVTIGPSQNVDEAGERVKQLLAAAGYRVGDFEYPEIAVSAAAY